MDDSKNLSQEILKEYGIRNNKKQKEKFINFTQNTLKEMGWDTEVHQGGSLLKSTNLSTVSDDPEFIFMAHYDTPKGMPLWINYYSMIFGSGFLPQILLGILIIKGLDLAEILLEGLAPINPSLPGILSLLLFLMILIPCILTNKNNYNDNSSGVLTLLSIAELLTA